MFPFLEIVCTLLKEKPAEAGLQEIGNHEIISFLMILIVQPAV